MFRRKTKNAAWAVLGIALLGLAPAATADADSLVSKPYRRWTMEEALEMLTDSPWARRETYTHVVGGIGSGISGEKEIYNTFFVRFLSARPIREAYARVKQVQANYDSLPREGKRKLDAALAPGLGLPVQSWIVVTVAFRSNDPGTELRIREFLEVQSAESLRTRAFLSTTRIPQVELETYFPPLEESVGAKFVFPRLVDGRPVIAREESRVAFELDLPGFDPDLRVSFPVSSMLVKGEPVY